MEYSDHPALEEFEGRVYIYLNWPFSRGLCFRVVALEDDILISYCNEFNFSSLYLLRDILLVDLFVLP